MEATCIAKQHNFVFTFMAALSPEESNLLSSDGATMTGSLYPLVVGFALWGMY
jgi:hypothetical protein